MRRCVVSKRSARPLRLELNDRARGPSPSHRERARLSDVLPVAEVGLNEIELDDVVAVV